MSFVSELQTELTDALRDALAGIHPTPLITQEGPEAVTTLAAGRDAIIIPAPHLTIQNPVTVTATWELWAITAAPDPTTATDQLGQIIQTLQNEGLAETARPDTFETPATVFNGYIITFTTTYTTNERTP